MTKEELQVKLNLLQDQILNASSMEEVNKIKLEIEKYKTISQVEEIKDDINLKDVYCIKAELINKKTKDDLTKHQMQQSNKFILNALKEETGIPKLIEIYDQPFYVRSGLTYDQAIGIKGKLEENFKGILTIEKAPDHTFHTDSHDELYCYKCGNVNMDIGVTDNENSAASHSILGMMSDDNPYLGAVMGDEFGRRFSKKKLVIKCNCCGNSYIVR